MLEVLRNRTYRRLFSAQIVALIGTGLLTVALGLLAFDLAGGDAGIVLGIALTIKMLAYVGIAPVISALTAHLPRKMLLVSADVLRAIVALSLPFVTEAWQIYVLIFVLQAASATFTPAFQALIPAVLPDESEYTRALSLSRLAYDLESLLSPILAAALLTVISYHSLFVGTVVGFVGSALLVLTTTLPTHRVATPTPFLDRLTRGVRVFWRTPELRALLAMNMVVATSTGMVIVNTVVLVQSHFGRAQSDFALALACYGFGSMLVALALPRVLERFDDRNVMLLGCAVLPVGLLSLAGIVVAPATPLTWSGLLVIWFVLGAATSSILTPSARLLRRSSDETNRPAVFAAQFSLSHACFIVTYPLAGILGAVLGLAPTAGVLAGIGILAGIIALRTWSAPTTPLAQVESTVAA
ncbi:MFS transporter [Cryobacterium levicorallinum]|uniref:MFS transporter n=1 Tax=Cryobacterium levicorallinum TaxID=995038 RepID=A0A1I3ECH9_9MICO|nr:MFS transporter [Cryobacterium levicorallinum]TFB84374.1 MFS transporter [Cryobacterium levicorallinum]GEP28697.1 MFS transporter [Cryobacterium levicorallinum]SFH96589.1 Predicted arabinose efflux permease, MFS family [Cryobacterium levicorallinum]